MAEKAEKDLSTQATEAGKDLKSTASKHWLAVLLVFLAFLVLCIRYRNTIVTKLGAWLPASVKKFLGIAVAALFVLALGEGASFASTCCAKPLAVAATGIGIFAALKTAAAALLAGGLMLGTALVAPDVVRCKAGTAGGQSFAFNYDDSTLQPEFDFYVDGSVSVDRKGRPLKATHQRIELTTTIDQISTTGTHAITDGEQARMVKSVKVTVPMVGEILNDSVGTGPIIKHLLEFIGNGFARMADAPLAAVTVPAAGDGGATTHNTATYTRFWSIPHKNKCLVDPMDSAIHMSILHNTTIHVALGKADCLGPVSTGALLTGASKLRVSTAYVADNKWSWPLIAQHVLETMLPGTDGVTLKRWGETGASGTEPVDFNYLIAVLSSKDGLPGNMSDLSVIAKLNSTKLDLVNLEALGAFFLERLGAQTYGRTSSVYDSGNFTDGVVPTGANLKDARFLAIRQPGLDMSLGTMFPYGNGYELPIDIAFTDGGAPTTKFGFLLSSMRQLDSKMAPYLQKQTNGKINADRGKVNFVNL